MRQSTEENEIQIIIICSSELYKRALRFSETI